MLAAVVDAAALLVIVGLVGACARQEIVPVIRPEATAPPVITGSARPSASLVPEASTLAIAPDPTESPSPAVTGSPPVTSSPHVEHPTVGAPDLIAYPVLGGRAKVRLAPEWQATSTPDLFESDSHVLSFAVGDRHGLITTCEPFQGPWEACDTVTVEKLEDLVGAVWPATSKSGNDSASSKGRVDGTLDGEPSVEMIFQGYEYPARSGQEVGYVVAIHGGRPFIVRIWTSENRLRQFEEVIDGFRFTD